MCFVQLFIFIGKMNEHLTPSPVGYIHGKMVWLLSLGQRNHHRDGNDRDGDADDDIGR